MAHLTPNQRALLDWIQQADRADEQMPSDADIMDRFDLTSRDQARTLLADLADRGEITLRWKGDKRTITLRCAAPAPAAPVARPEPTVKRVPPTPPTGRRDLIAAVLAKKRKEAAAAAAKPAPAKARREPATRRSRVMPPAPTPTRASPTPPPPAPLPTEAAASPPPAPGADLIVCRIAPANGSAGFVPDQFRPMILSASLIVEVRYRPAPPPQLLGRVHVPAAAVATAVCRSLPLDAVLSELIALGLEHQARALV